MTGAYGVHSIGSVPCPPAAIRPLAAVQASAAAAGSATAVGASAGGSAAGMAASPRAGCRLSGVSARRYPALTKRRVIDYCRVATAL